ncbi:hypothetical protein ACPPVW_09565 [Leifsonia sp. McL0607]|uniref:hypothetical protein n=1 Tax=Leifsonia sp. McL0607 TaxID=3415672 RepID=UPI003CF20EFD
MTRPILSSGLIALIVGVPLIVLSSIVAFDPPFTSIVHFAMWCVVRILFLALLTLSILYARRFFARVREGDPAYRRWLAVGLALVAVNTVILILTWPGYWVWDEFYILRAVQANSVQLWQHVFTSLYFGVALSLIPTPAGILIVQYVFGSFVAGYVIARSWSLVPRPALAYLLLIPFLSFPVLLFNQYPMRAMPMGYIELAALFRILVVHLRPELVTNRYREFFFLTSAISIVAFWRSEAILLLALIPVLAISLRIFRPTQAGVRTRTAVAAILASGLVIVGAGGVTAVTTSPRYSVTAVVNPLSEMLQHPLGGPNLTQNLEAIDKVVDLDVLRENSSVYNIPAFFEKPLLRTDYQAHLRGFQLGFISLVAENPLAFLSARSQTFLATNSVGDVPGPDIQTRFLDGSNGHLIADFEERNPTAVPFWDGVRNTTIRTLLTIPSGTAPTPLTTIVWTILPLLLGIIASFFVALLRRRWLFAAIFGLLITQVGITFITAPANFFMYYWPVYLVGWALLGFFILRSIPSRKKLMRSADTHGTRWSRERP